MPTKKMKNFNQDSCCLSQDLNLVPPENKSKTSQKRCPLSQLARCMTYFTLCLAVGRKLANSCGCKFIETSSGLDHNVDELLVGILAQVQLNPWRDCNKLSKKKKQKARMGSGHRILKNLLGIKRKSRSCENLFVM